MIPLRLLLTLTLAASATTASSSQVPSRLKQEPQTPGSCSPETLLTTTTQALTVEEAVRLALRRSPSAERARWERDAALAAAQRDAPRFAPELSLVGAGLLNQPEITFPRGATGQDAVIVPTSRVQLLVMATAPLFRSGAPAAGRRARAATRAADLALEQNLATTRREVKQAYYALATAEAGLTVAREGLELARAHRRLVDDLVQSGNAARIDQLRGDVQVEEAATAAADAEEGRSLAAARLLQLIGDPRNSIDPDNSSLLRLTLPEGEPGQEPDEAEALAAIERRPDIQALVAQVEAAELGAALARAQSSPSVDLQLGYALQTPSAFVARSSWSAGLSLTVPLGARRRMAADAQEAAARARAVSAALDELRQGAALEVRQALQAVRSAKRRRAGAARAVAAAEEALRITELQFQAGHATSLEVAGARAALQRHRLDALRAFYDAHAAMADLERATGAPLPEPDPGP